MRTLRFPAGRALAGHAAARLAPALLAVAILLPSTAGAQTTAADLAPGTRVRVVLADSLRPAPFAPRLRGITGTVARATPDTLYLRAGPVAADTLRIPRAQLRSAFVSLGASRARSAVVQGLAGAVTVALAVWAVNDAYNRPGVGTAVGRGAAVGLGGGALMGLLSPYEHWRRLRR